MIILNKWQPWFPVPEKEAPSGFWIDGVGYGNNLFLSRKKKGPSPRPRDDAPVLDKRTAERNRVPSQTFSKTLPGKEMGPGGGTITNCKIT